MTLIAPQSQKSPQRFRFTREAYYQMAEQGHFNGHRVELIEGEIIEMAPMKDPHAVAMGVVGHVLRHAFPGCWVRDQLPLTVGENSEPVPDLAVVRGDPREYLSKGHPKAALLVVEISDAPLRFDRGRKASLYARAGNQEYWIINLMEGCLEVMRDPVADVGARLGWKYGSVVTLRAGESVSPLARPEVKIAVADLLL